VTQRIAFIDTACFAFPRGDGQASEHHCARIAALVEEDGQNAGTMVHLIKPAPGWKQDAAAVPYHRAAPADFAEHGIVPATVAAELATLLREVDLIVSHNAQFHRRMLTALYADSGILEPMRSAPNFCTMNESADVCRIKLQSQGRWKLPKLIEAYRFFGGQSAMDELLWDRFAAQQVAAVRRIYKGLQQRKG
jgi:hypothetical protein